MVAENGGVEPHTIQYSLFSRQDRRPRLIILQKIKTPDSPQIRSQERRNSKLVIKPLRHVKALLNEADKESRHSLYEFVYAERIIDKSIVVYFLRLLRL